MTGRMPPACPEPALLTEADAPAVAQLFERCADYFLMQDGETATLADARDLFADVPPGKDRQDQTVLGWPGLNGLDALVTILRNYPSDGIWYLGLMLIDPDLRRHGVGRSLYASVERWAADHGVAEIRLAVLEDNQNGESFWRSLGFQEIRRTGPDDFKRKRHRRIELNRVLSMADMSNADGGQRDNFSEYLLGSPPRSSGLEVNRLSGGVREIDL